MLFARTTISLLLFCSATIVKLLYFFHRKVVFALFGFQKNTFVEQKRRRASSSFMHVVCWKLSTGGNAEKHFTLMHKYTCFTLYS